MKLSVSANSGVVTAERTAGLIKTIPLASLEALAEDSPSRSS